MPENFSENTSIKEEKIKEERSMVLSVYIDFSPETKRKTGWELLPDGEVYTYPRGNQNEESFNKRRSFDYQDVLIFLEHKVVEDLENELRNMIGDKLIEIRHPKTNVGSIELILAIYGAYASINDFIETSQRIQEFVDSFIHSNLSNRYGSIFTTNTTFASPMPRQFKFNFNTWMLILTALISVFTVGVLLVFSYNFISKIIVGSTVIAGFLALIIELSKITTTYHAVNERKKNKKLSRLGQTNQAVRVFAILLSSLFCLGEISEINTAPNLETYKKEKLSNIDDKLKMNSDIIIARYDDENVKLNEQIVVVSKPSMTRRNSSVDYMDIINNNEAINLKIAKNSEAKVKKLEELKENAEKDKKQVLQSVSKDPEVNSKKINTVLTTVFGIPLDSENYALSYRYFIIISSLLVTLLVEAVSITSMQGVSRFFTE
ncbi:MAG TPA: hypothetical protein VGO50_11660 [Pyrinomonadaceae bacterium]|jgi:hypothetical protein|nr:hypothetical protein [Pyrinomonadaceae bacterium]